MWDLKIWNLHKILYQIHVSFVKIRPGKPKLQCGEGRKCTLNWHETMVPLIFIFSETCIYSSIEAQNNRISTLMDTMGSKKEKKPFAWTMESVY